jgi:SAM-dependent methyltransferase
MNKREFDKFADEYRAVHSANIAVSGETPEYFAEYKIRDLKNLLSPDFDTGRFLDFGAGLGTSVSFFRKYFPVAELTCVDVSLKSLEIGVAQHGGQANFVAFDGAHLPFGDAAFDCVFAACVFHHIPPALHLSLFAEMRRVLRPEGCLMVYEHNPLNPLTVRLVNSCEFDENAILIRAGALRAQIEAAGFIRPGIRYRVFFPRLLSWLRPFESSLSWLPFGAQYYVYGSR